MARKRLQDMVAFITGAGGGSTGGIGASIALCMAKEGAKIAVNDLTEESALKTVKLIEEIGGEAFSVIGSIAMSSKATELVNNTVDYFGKIDILVNSAGIGGKPDIVETLDDDNWANVINTNLSGCFYTSRAAIKYMRPQGFGRIINISSLAGARTSLLGNAAYTSSKAGLLGFTRHLATEVGQYGITVNSILPGSVLTPMFKANCVEEKLYELSRMAPVMRLAVPEDIGWLAAFLATKEAGYITGTAIPVDGAISALSGNYGAYLDNTKKKG